MKTRSHELKVHPCFAAQDKNREEAAMQKKISLLLVCIVFIACWYLWPEHRQITSETVVQQNNEGKAQAEQKSVTTDAETVVQTIHVGMSVSEVRTAMKVVSLDSGTWYFGGTGAFRLYFELPQQRQIWVNCERTPTGVWKVVEVSKIEPKQEWVHHEGDSISVK